jgi:hypothetical protein
VTARYELTVAEWGPTGARSTTLHPGRPGGPRLRQSPPSAVVRGSAEWAGYFEGKEPMKRALMVSAMVAFCVTGAAIADNKENADDFMQIHKIEIAFHQAGTTKNLALMLSLFADDATITSGGKTYTGKEQIASFWKSAGPFQPQNQWVAYTPAFRIKYDVQGDSGHLYFECLYVDKAANKIAAHTNSNDTLIRVNGRWLIKEMKAAKVPEL